MTRAERHTAPPLTATQLEERDRAARKVALGRRILADGPISAHDIGVACAAAGAPVQQPDRYARTLVNPCSGFLVLCSVAPRRYDLSERGRLWVQAVISGQEL